VVDDGSEDQTEVRRLIENIKDNRLRGIFLNQNMGKWNALNTAIESSNAAVFTSHDADDISLPWRIESQLEILLKTKTAHNLCGFVSCWNEEDVKRNYSQKKPDNLKFVGGDEVFNVVAHGFNTPGINHYYTGQFETAGVSSMFLKSLWNAGMRFNPPGKNLRVLHSEDSDFNCRMTLLVRSTSILLETPYLYRRNTSTNREER
jgi:glycosyltransferase involved in cell wall biosynthesis